MRIHCITGMPILGYFVYYHAYMSFCYNSVARLGIDYINRMIFCRQILIVYFTVTCSLFSDLWLSSAILLGLNKPSLRSAIWSRRSSSVWLFLWYAYIRYVLESLFDRSGQQNEIMPKKSDALSRKGVKYCQFYPYPHYEYVLSCLICLITCGYSFFLVELSIW